MNDTATQGQTLTTLFSYFYSLHLDLQINLLHVYRTSIAYVNGMFHEKFLPPLLHEVVWHQTLVIAVTMPASPGTYLLIHPQVVLAKPVQFGKISATFSASTILEPGIVEEKIQYSYFAFLFLIRFTDFMPLSFASRRK